MDLSDPAIIAVAALTAAGRGPALHPHRPPGILVRRGQHRPARAVLARARCSGCSPSRSPPRRSTTAWPGCGPAPSATTRRPCARFSALAGVLTVPVAFAAARRLFSPRAGVILAALVACNPLLIWYSQEARSYALLVLLTSLSLLAFLRAREEPSPRPWPPGWWPRRWLWPPTTTPCWPSSPRPRGCWSSTAACGAAVLAVGVVGVCGLALIPAGLEPERPQPARAGFTRASLTLRLGQLVPEFLVGFQMPAQSVLEPLACVLAAGPSSWRSGAAIRARAGGWRSPPASAWRGFALILVLVAGRDRRPASRATCWRCGYRARSS